MTELRSRDSVSIDIAAPPEKVYALVSDVTRMGEWSPECRSCRWTRGATGPTVGARFKARNKGRRGPPWFNTPTVTVADPGREFAFNRSGPGMGSYTWRYRLEPTATGTELTESYDAEPPVPKLMSWLTEKWVGSNDRDADLPDGMVKTLQRIKAAAETRLTITGGVGGITALFPRAAALRSMRSVGLDQSCKKCPRTPGR